MDQLEDLRIEYYRVDLVVIRSTTLQCVDEMSLIRDVDRKIGRKRCSFLGMFLRYCFLQCVRSSCSINMYRYLSVAIRSSLLPRMRQVSHIVNL